MSQRDKYERLLTMLSVNKILKIRHCGIRVADLVQRLKDELQKPSLSINSINTILEKIKKATERKIPWALINISCEKESILRSKTFPDEPAEKDDFWSRSKIYPLRQYKK
jgi:hypothetical protein